MQLIQVGGSLVFWNPEENMTYVTNKIFTGKIFRIAYVRYSTLSLRQR